MKFQIGKLVATRAVATNMQEYPAFEQEVWVCFSRYTKCDWGELSKNDIKENEFALIHNLRILASYETSVGKIWIITEANRSSTTILFPSDY